jgi:hypothetical protein
MLQKWRVARPQTGFPADPGADLNLRRVEAEAPGVLLLDALDIAVLVRVQQIARPPLRIHEPAPPDIVDIGGQRLPVAHQVFRERGRLGAL